MKKKEIMALGLSVAMATMTGCASQDEVNSLNAQVSELQAQVTELQNELSSEQSKSESAQNENANLEAQAESLQNEIESLNEELENVESIIESAETTTNEMSINVTKYAESGSTVFARPEEAEEYKIMELELNSECYVVATFSDANDDEMWSAIASLVTVDEDGNKTYEIISSATKGSEKSKNKNIDFMMRGIESITVDGQTIKADELGENQEIRIVYARTSLLSNSKVTEQQKTSAEKSSTPKQTQQPAASADDGWGYIPPEMIVGTDNVTDNLGGINLQFN